MTDATLRMLARLRATHSLPPLQLGAAPAPTALASAVVEPEPLVADVTLPLIRLWLTSGDTQLRGGDASLTVAAWRVNDNDDRAVP